jgi:hypothetical protein
MPIGKKLKTETGHIWTMMRGDLTTKVWKDKQKENIMNIICIIFKEMVIFVISMITGFKQAIIQADT